MKKYVTLAVLLACSSVVWGQSMFSTKSQLPNNGWNKPTVDSIFNHALTTNEKQNVWFSIPGSPVWVSSNAFHTVGVDASCNGYLYNDGKKNSWTKHSEWGCVKELSYGYDGNLYGLVHPRGSDYWLSRWSTIAGWVDINCCMDDFRVSKKGLIVMRNSSGGIWASTNYGVNFTSYPGCAANPEAIAAHGLDSNGNPTFYVVCKNSGGIFYFDGSAYEQLPGTASAVAVAPDGDTYIVASNGNVQHWNGTAWDDMVTNTPVTSLSVGGPFDVWMIGPKAANGSVIWRTWENGLILTHSYGGSVSCGQGVPQALCSTFTHNVSHQICFGSHCGAVSTSSWNGQGSWGPSAQVFATPYDLWTCLLAGEPAGPCGLAENEGSMECSGGGSNSDNAPSLNWVVGDSIDVLSYINNVGETGPIASVGAGGGVGYYAGTISNNVRDSCRVSDPIPVCPVNTDVPLEIFNKVTWFGKQYQLKALDQWEKDQEDHEGGFSSPYVSHGFYIGQADASGNLIQGTQECFGGWLGEKDFLYGDYDLAPSCK